MVPRLMSGLSCCHVVRTVHSFEPLRNTLHQTPSKYFALRHSDSEWRRLPGAHRQAVMWCRQVSRLPKHTPAAAQGPRKDNMVARSLPMLHSELHFHSCNVSAKCHGSASMSYIAGMVPLLAQLGGHPSGTRLRLLNLLPLSLLVYVVMLCTGYQQTPGEVAHMSPCSRTSQYSPYGPASCYCRAPCMKAAGTQWQSATQSSAVAQ